MHLPTELILLSFIFHDTTQDKGNSPKYCKFEKDQYEAISTVTNKSTCLRLRSLIACKFAEGDVGICEKYQDAAKSWCPNFCESAASCTMLSNLAGFTVFLTILWLLLFAKRAS